MLSGQPAEGGGWVGVDRIHRHTYGYISSTHYRAIIEPLPRLGLSLNPPATGPAMRHSGSPRSGKWRFIGYIKTHTYGYISG